MTTKGWKAFLPFFPALNTLGESGFFVNAPSRMVCYYRNSIARFVSTLRAFFLGLTQIHLLHHAVQEPIFVAAMKHRSLYMCPRLKKHFSKKR